MTKMTRGILLAIVFSAFLPTAASDSGDDFTNNLFSDLAPLLALFGERGAQQFMSQSMGLVDCIIFAMAPLGLLTAVIGAIRIGGSGWLKALIGRAREAYAVPELELLSSTSSEVCELWDGLTLVRVLGSPKIAELVYFPKTDGETSSPAGSSGRHWGIDTTSRIGYWHKRPTVSEDLLKSLQSLDGRIPLLSQLRNYFSRNSRYDVEKNPTSPNDTKPGKQSPIKDGGDNSAIKPSAPNISLNITKPASQKQLWTVALVGILLQCAVLVFDALATYHPILNKKFPKNGREVAKYAFPLTAVGTLLVVLGMFICAHVVEDATKEVELEYMKNGEGLEMRVIWLQKHENVGGQNFDSYAIFARDKRTSIRTSRRREPQPGQRTQPAIPPQLPKLSKSTPLSLRESSRPEMDNFLSTLTTFGTVTSFIGFIIQFLGLRAMSWATTIVQLVATVIMTGLRSWLTTAGLSQEPDTCKLPREYELDWLATRIGDLRDGLYEKLSEEKMDAEFWSPCSWKWRVVTERHRTAESWSKLPSSGRANQVVEARKHLHELTGWTREGSMAASVANAIEEFMNSIFSSDYVTLETGFTERLKFKWPMFIKFGDVEESYYLRLSRDSTKKKWKADPKAIEAVLSLWTYTLRETREPEYADEFENPCKAEGLFGEMLEELEELEELSEAGEDSCKRLRFLGPADPISQKCYRLWIYRGTDFKIFRRKDAKSEHEYQAIGFPVNPSLSTQRKATDAELDETLSAATDTSVEAMCAQDIFSTFVWYISDNIKAITPKTTLAKNSLGVNQEVWQPPSFRNPFIENILSSVESTGLGTTEEMCMSIIPPLHSSGIFHDIDFGSQELISYVDERAGLFEAQDDLEEAGKAYEWLYDTCIGYLQTEPSAFCRAAVMLAHFSASANDATTISRGYNMCPEIKSQRTSSLFTISSSALRKVRSGPHGQVIHQVLEDAYEAAGGIQRLPKITTDSEKRDPETLSISPVIVQGPKTIGDSVDNNNNLSYGDSVEDIVRDLVFPNPGEQKLQNFLGWTVLHYAAAERSRYDLKGLLDTRAPELDTQDRDGRTPLHWAVLNAQIECVGILLEAGCDQNIGDKTAMTPLHLAVVRENKDIVMHLLTEKTDLERRNSKGWTALHLAASAGFQDGVELLLENGAEIGARDTKQRTPLHLAAISGVGHVIKTLLDGKADKTAGDLNGSTALHLAAQQGSELCVVALLEKDADIEARDVLKRTPLHVAVIAGQGSVVEILMREGASIESRDVQEATALHLAAQQGRQNEIEMLLEKGANIEAKDIVGETPLLRAFANKRYDVVRLLLERRANVNAVSDNGDCVLQLAAFRGDLSIAKILLDHGAHRNLQRRQGTGDGFQKVVDLCYSA